MNEPILKALAGIHLNMPGNIIVALDIRGWVTLANTAAGDLLGYDSDDELLGQDWFKVFIPESSYSQVRDAFDDMIGGNLEPYRSYENEVLLKDGSSRLVQWYDEYIIDDDGKIIGVVLSGRDITRERQTEQALLEQRELLLSVIDENPDPVVVKDEDAKFILVNKACAELYGSSPEMMIGKDDGDFIPDEEQVEFFRQNAQKIMRTGETEIVYEESIDVNTGEHRHYRSVKRPYKDSKGRSQILIIAHDMTIEMRIHEQLKKSQYYQQALLDNFPFLVWLKDKDSTFLAVNRPFADAAEISEVSDVIGKDDLDVWPERLARQYRDDDALVMETLQKKDVEEKIAVDGEMCWFETYKAPVIDRDGVLLGTVGFSRDISARKRDEEVLRLMEYSLDHVDVANYLIEASGRFMRINEQACTELGYSKETLQSMNAFDIAEGLSPSQWPEHFDDLRQKGSFTFEVRHRRKDGSTFPVEINAHYVEYLGEGYNLSFVRDISERKAAEQIMREQEQMILAQSRHAAMGEMISMIAHQWRQPLTVIAMAASNILIDIEMGEFETREIEERAKNVIKQTKHLSQTIDDFRDFFRPNKGLELVDLKDVMSDAQKILGKSLENLEIVISVKIKHSYKIKTYPRELLQVYINLISNAKDSLIGSRTIEPKIDIAMTDEKEKIITTICDNGGGIDATIIGKIFDPYFTTKMEQTGTGLGLYMSKTIIEKHLQGELTAYNTQKGACFKIVMPMELQV